MLRSLVEDLKGSSKGEEDEEFANNDDTRSICTVVCTVVPHELEHIEKEHAEQQEADEGDEER